MSQRKTVRADKKVGHEAENEAQTIDLRDYGEKMRTKRRIAIK